jgi:hypothetical protein
MEQPCFSLYGTVLLPPTCQDGGKHCTPKGSRVINLSGETTFSFYFMDGVERIVRAPRGGVNRCYSNFNSFSFRLDTKGKFSRYATRVNSARRFMPGDR